MIKIETITEDQFPLIKMVVAKDGENVVGRVFLMSPTHIEGMWVAEHYRSGSVAKRLMDRIAEEAKSLGIVKLFAYATDDKLAGYMARLGYQKEPYTVWTKEL